MPDCLITKDVQQRLASRRRLVEAVLERKFDDEVLVTMMMAGLEQARGESLLAAAAICEDAAAASGRARHVASTLERSLRILVELNKAIPDWPSVTDSNRHLSA